MRDRGGVLSMAATAISRHEQQSASTTPGTTTAGTVAYTGLEMAARAKIRTSSTRLMTALRTAETLRYVAVSRKGFNTILVSSSEGSHSTPIGATLTRPDASRVVTMVSTITRCDTPARWMLRRQPRSGG